MGNFHQIIPLYDNDENTNLEKNDSGFMTVGMAYVPVQAWNQTYGLSEALARGTQFPELDKPFFAEDIWK